VVLHRFRRALQAADLPRLRLHDPRHGTASLLVAQQVDLEVVREVVGHARLATTVEIYAHLLPEARREAAGRMQDILVPVEPPRDARSRCRGCQIGCQARREPRRIGSDGARS
jgi:Phage integrase family